MQAGTLGHVGTQQLPLARTSTDTSAWPHLPSRRNMSHTDLLFLSHVTCGGRKWEWMQDWGPRLHWPPRPVRVGKGGSGCIAKAGG